MRIGRRSFMGMAAAAVGAGLLGDYRAFAQEAAQGLQPMTGDVVPIGREEFARRLAKAQRLMGEQGLAAILIEPGASMTYFSGVQWWRSERLTALIIPREGEPCVVTPHFEEPSVRESLKVPAEVRVWNEHENPLERVAQFLRDRRLTGPVGIEETVRFFAVAGTALVAMRTSLASQKFIPPYSGFASLIRGTGPRRKVRVRADRNRTASVMETLEKPSPIRRGPFARRAVSRRVKGGTRAASAVAALERFQAKYDLVRIKKTRRIKTR